jgi:hypothetical protein
MSTAPSFTAANDVMLTSAALRARAAQISQCGAVFALARECMS